SCGYFTKPCRSVVIQRPTVAVSGCDTTKPCCDALWRHDVTDGDLKFSLESVKKLKELMDENRSINPRMVVSKTTYSPCNEKDLPEEFQAVCKREDAPMIFERLSMAVRDADLCEICANAACSGCF
ncbi:guanylin-like, partial [Aythya fuligula]|uniref:Guanylate cyclase activator 2B n=2 Tax=Anatidae TaxID=8830 RepID=A0A6J3E1T3_AYTFU